jgi:hypothetical protein
MVALNVWPTDGADGSVATEARWREMARLWAPSSVCAGVGGELAPALAGTNLTIADGAVWIDGHFAELTGSQVLAVTANGLAVVRFDPAENSAELNYWDGVSAPYQDPNGAWDLPIALITGGALVDMRQRSRPVPSGLEFLGRRATAWAGPTDNTFQHVPFDSVLVNVAGRWSPGPSSWLAPRSGFVEVAIAAQCRLDTAIVANGGFIASVYVDAAEWRIGQMTVGNITAATLGGVAIVPVTAGQAVSMQTYFQNGAGKTKTVDIGSFMAVRYIG